MKQKKLRLQSEFAVAVGNKKAQAAEMVLAPGDCEGGPDNSHRGSDQWMFVVAGTGVAIIESRRVKLSAGTLLLIERGETHEIRNTGRRPLQTVNLYIPPAYNKSGNPLPRGKP
jgi:mannose-6-phosphate isomerase-like protein (cupin superfamily)